MDTVTTIIDRIAFNARNEGQSFDNTVRDLTDLKSRVKGSIYKAAKDGAAPQLRTDTPYHEGLEAYRSQHGANYIIARHPDFTRMNDQSDDDLRNSMALVLFAEMYAKKGDARTAFETATINAAKMAVTRARNAVEPNRAKRGGGKRPPKASKANEAAEPPASTNVQPIVPDKPHKFSDAELARKYWAEMAAFIRTQAESMKQAGNPKDVKGIGQRVDQAACTFAKAIADALRD